MDAEAANGWRLLIVRVDEEALGMFDGGPDPDGRIDCEFRAAGGDKKCPT